MADDNEDWEGDDGDDADDGNEVNDGNAEDDDGMEDYEPEIEKPALLTVDDELLDQIDDTVAPEDDDGEEDETDFTGLESVRISELEISESNDDQATNTSKTGRKVLSSDAESSPESENEEVDQADRQEIPAEYWQVQRLIKYVKAGNPTATIIAMSSLRDYNLRDYYVQMAIKEAGGLEVLLNILETDENRCKIAAMLVLREISANPEISRNIYNMRVTVQKVFSNVNSTNCIKVYNSRLIFAQRFYSRD